MQRIILISIGRLSEKFYAEGVAEYTKRLQPFCRFESVELAEQPIQDKIASPAVIAKALEKEGMRILEAIPKGAKIIALCIEGAQFSSEKLATWLEEAALSGAGDVVFVIGSSHGLAPEIKKKAALCLSLSAMTFPHQMARLVVTEQIYRACMIRSNGKYHK